jgi:hypothetical protein
LFHKDPVLHVPDNVHKGRLGESNACAGAEVECRLDIVKIRSAIINYCPSDAAAMLSREMQLDCHDIP